LFTNCNCNGPLVTQVCIQGRGSDRRSCVIYNDIKIEYDHPLTQQHMNGPEMRVSARGTVLLGLAYAAYRSFLFLDRDELFPPRIWGIVSISLWLAYVALRGWRKLSLFERQQLLWAICSTTSLFYYLQYDPEFRSWGDGETPHGPCVDLVRRQAWVHEVVASATMKNQPHAHAHAQSTTSVGAVFSSVHATSVGMPKGGSRPW